MSLKKLTAAAVFAAIAVPATAGSLSTTLKGFAGKSYSSGEVVIYFSERGSPMIQKDGEVQRGRAKVLRTTRTPAGTDSCIFLSAGAADNRVGSFCFPEPSATAQYLIEAGPETKFMLQ